VSSSGHVFWHVGGIAAGDLAYSSGAGDPLHIVSDVRGGFVSVGAFADGTHLLAFVDAASPPRLNLSLGRP